MVSMFWVHYQRKADGQDFHEWLTTGGLMKLLAQGRIVLCGLEMVHEKSPQKCGQ